MICPLCGGGSLADAIRPIFGNDVEIPEEEGMPSSEEVVRGREEEYGVRNPRKL